MLNTLWKFRLVVILAVVVLVAGGAIAVAAKEGTFGDSSPKAGTGLSQNGEGGQNGQEPTHATEPTATPKPPEPTAIPHTTVSGKITSVDCANNSITITEDNGGGSFTASLTSGTVYTIGSATGACSDLQVGWHVSIEAQELSAGVWTATHITQDDSGQGSGSGGGGSGEATPTPGASH